MSNPTEDAQRLAEGLREFIGEFDLKYSDIITALEIVRDNYKARKEPRK